MAISHISIFLRTCSILYIVIFLTGQILYLCNAEAHLFEIFKEMSRIFKKRYNSSRLARPSKISKDVARSFKRSLICGFDLPCFRRVPWRDLGRSQVDISHAKNLLCPANFSFLQDIDLSTDCACRPRTSSASAHQYIDQSFSSSSSSRKWQSLNSYSSALWVKVSLDIDHMIPAQAMSTCFNLTKAWRWPTCNPWQPPYGASLCERAIDLLHICTDYVNVEHSLRSYSCLKK
jgi:hypothetical protein